MYAREFIINPRRKRNIRYAGSIGGWMVSVVAVSQSRVVERIHSNREGPGSRMKRGVDRAGLRCAATTKSLIICRRLSEGLRDVEREKENSNPSAAGLRFPRLTCPIEILISRGGRRGKRGCRVQRKCNAGRGIDRLFLPSRDDEMLFRGPTMGRGNNKQEKQKKRKKEKREREGRRKRRWKK